MLEEYDTWSQVFNQISEVSSAAEFRTMITDRLMGNQANGHSRGNTTSQVSVELLKCCRISTTRTTVLSRECSLRIQYSCIVKRDANFFEWSITGNPTEPGNWSTMIIRQSSIHSLNTRRKMTSCITREKTGLCGVQYRHGLSQTG